MRRSAGSWIAPLGVAVIVLVILVVVAVAATRESDPTPPIAEPTPATSSEATSPATPTEAPSTPAAPSVDIVKPAKEAAKDGFPALLPAEVPAGWVATAASYTPGSGGAVWELSFLLPDGGVVALIQSELPLPRAVSRYLGTEAERSGRVDLRKFGTGYWFTYTAGQGVGLAKQLPTDTSIVIAAPDQDSAVTLAKQLLTFEDYAVPEAG